MLSVTDARKRLLEKLSPVPATTIPLEEAVGRVLAEALVAEEPSPPFNNSAMDGFAVIAADLAAASTDAPVSLKVVGDIPAGHMPKVDIEPGQTMRIMTGAITPDSADSIVPVEKTDFNYRGSDEVLPKTVQFTEPVKKGRHLRAVAENYAIGETLIPTGRRLRPKDVGLLAQSGKSTISAYQRPLVALFSTGDELLALDEAMEPGKIRESNSHTLSALLTDCGAEVLNLGIYRDIEAEIRSALDKAVEAGVDMIISSAGVSVGAYDFIRIIIAEQGDLDFWKVNMRPGKPFLFGHYRGVPYVGLPGNPVSSFVGFEVFLRPALHYMGGVENWNRLTWQATLTEEVTSDGRESYLRVVLEKDNEKWSARPIDNQGSGNLYSLAQANGMIIVPAGVESLPAGATVEAWLI